MKPAWYNNLVLYRNTSKGETIMKHFKLILAALTVTVVGGLSIYAKPVQAASYSASRANSVSLVWRANMGKHYFKAQQGGLYSRHLGNKYLDVKTEPNKTWYTVAHEKLRVKKTGKTRIYYNVKSVDGKYSGWIWRGYLTATKASNQTTKPVTVDSEYIPQDQYTTLRSELLTAINAKRTANNEAPLIMTKGLFNVSGKRVAEVAAQGAANQTITHTRSDGSSAATYWAKELNVNTHGFKGVADAVGYAPGINNDVSSQAIQITDLFGDAQWKSLTNADYAMIGMSFYLDPQSYRLYFALNYC